MEFGKRLFWLVRCRESFNQAKVPVQLTLGGLNLTWWFGSGDLARRDLASHVRYI